jgi:hypothetical protein
VSPADRRDPAIAPAPVHAPLPLFEHCPGPAIEHAPALQLERQPGWPLHLEHAIERARGQAFDWTGHNCATFAADCVAAITGVRLHGRFAALMATERRARAFGPALAARVDDVLGAARRVPPRLAQRGDVVLVDVHPGPALAVCVGAKAAAVSPEGLVFVGMEAVRCAWHI